MQKYEILNHEENVSDTFHYTREVRSLFHTQKIFFDVKIVDYGREKNNIL
jgi:hypothetical protein